LTGELPTEELQGGGNRDAAEIETFQKKGRPLTRISQLKKKKVPKSRKKKNLPHFPTRRENEMALLL